MSVIAVVDLRLRPEAVAGAPQVLHAVLDQTRGRPGCVSVVVIQDVTDPAHVTAIETWESVEADKAYREWRAGEGATSALTDLLAGAPTLWVGGIREDV